MANRVPIVFCGRDDLTVLGLRFTGDRIVPAERFARLREELGDRFVGVEIDSSKGNPWGHRAQAHLAPAAPGGGHDREAPARLPAGHR